jgi:hypothetical protein
VEAKTFLRNVGFYKTRTAPHPRRWQSSESPLWKRKSYTECLICSKRLMSEKFVYTTTELTPYEKSTQISSPVTSIRKYIPFPHVFHTVPCFLIILYWALIYSLRRLTCKTFYLPSLGMTLFFSDTAWPRIRHYRIQPLLHKHFYSPRRTKPLQNLMKLLASSFSHIARFNHSIRLPTPTQS